MAAKKTLIEQLTEQLDRLTASKRELVGAHLLGTVQGVILASPSWERRASREARAKAKRAV